MGGIAFDNLKPAVARIGRRRSDKAYTAEITRLATYYGFSVNACNPPRGNENGHVDNSGNNARAEFSSTVYEIATWEDMEADRNRVMADYNRRSADGFAKDRLALRPCRDRGTSLPASARSRPTNTHPFRRCRTSTPCRKASPARGLDRGP